jgi:hypothetical protein
VKKDYDISLQKNQRPSELIVACIILSNVTLADLVVKEVIIHAGTYPGLRISD